MISYIYLKLTAKSKMLLSSCLSNESALSCFDKSYPFSLKKVYVGEIK